MKKLVLLILFLVAFSFASSTVDALKKIVSDTFDFESVDDWKIDTPYWGSVFEGCPLYDEPDESSEVVGWFHSEIVQVLVFGDENWVLVQTLDGDEGWLDNLQSSARPSLFFVLTPLDTYESWQEIPDYALDSVLRDFTLR